MKKYGALILGLALSWQSVEAKTVLISDIDDTIKNSHILKLTASIRNAFTTKVPLFGMAEIYDLLERQHVANRKEIQFHYVSNAPDVVGLKHIKFANQWGFPSAANEGSFYFRSFPYNDSAHKVNTIKKIVKADIEQIIFVGDNGEQDILVYQEASAWIRKKFPRIKIATYIRMGYWTNSSKDTGLAPVENQIGFATPLDLVLDWNSKGLIDGSLITKKDTDDAADKNQANRLKARQALSNFITYFSIRLNAEKSNEKLRKLIFPKWVDCRDVKFSADLLLGVPAESIELAAATLDQVVDHCSDTRGKN